jgi:hypothetical protein
VIVVGRAAGRVLVVVGELGQLRPDLVERLFVGETLAGPSGNVICQNVRRSPLCI